MEGLAIHYSRRLLNFSGDLETMFYSKPTDEAPISEVIPSESDGMVRTNKHRYRHPQGWKQKSSQLQ